MKKHIQKDCSATNPISENKTSKPTRSSKTVQYFTFGKDNCLVQLTTSSQNKKSSTDAVFCKIDPFNTSGDKINYRKVKSTLGLPYTQKKCTLHPNVHQEAISRFTKKLKCDLAFSALNSDFNPIIIEGKSIKLNPKKSICDSKTYCKGIKRCKMCGEVMLDFDPSISPISNRCSSIDSCSDCKLNKISSIVDKSVEKSKGYGNYLSPTKVATATSSGKLPSSTKPIKNVVFSNATGSQANKNASDNFSARPKCDIGELALARALVREYSKKEANSAIKLVSNAKTNMPIQTKATFITDRLNPKSKNPTEKFTVESNLAQEQFKNASTGGKSASVKMSSINAIAKSLSERNRISTRSKDNAGKLPSESCVNRKQYKNTNVTSAKTVTEKSSKPAQIRLLSESNNFITKSKSTLAELTAKNYVNKGRSKTTSVGNKGASTDEPNVPTQVKSLPDTNGHNTRPKITSDEFTSEIYIDKEDGQNVNMDAATCNNISEELAPEIYIDDEVQNIGMFNKRFSDEELNVPIQAYSLNETNRSATKITSVKETCSSDSAIEKQQCLSRNVSNKIICIEEENLPAQIELTPKSKSTFEELTSTNYVDQEEGSINIGTSKSNSISEECLSETSQTTIESNTSEIITPENYINNEQCRNANKANKSTSTDKLNMPFQFESLSQEELDLLSKCADILHGISSCEKDRSSGSGINNVSVNNYYFLTGSDLKKAKCNSSVVHSFSPAKYLSSENISVVSENEDELEVDQVKGQNGFHVNQDKSSSSLLQLKFKKAILEELCGVFKLKTDKFLEDLCQSQYDLPLYNDRCSEIDHCTAIGKVSESSNIYHDILRRQIAFKNLKLSVDKNIHIHSQDSQSLYCIKTLNPYVQKSLRIIEEMDRVRNEPIDPDKVLEELKKDKHLMKTIEKMAAKKLNFSRKTTVFKNLTSK